MPSFRTVAELDTGGVHSVAMADDTTIVHLVKQFDCPASTDGANFCSVSPSWAKGGSGGNTTGQGQVFPT